MRILIPTSLADVHLLPDFVELYCRLGGTPNQSVYLFPTSEVLTEARAASVRMAPFAKSLQVIPWEMDNKHPWPAAGNFMFQHCVAEMEARGDSEPFYYMELDNTPLEPGWGDKLANGYTLSGCKWMGTTVPMRQKLPNGQIVVDEQDHFMIGTGIYPQNFTKLCEGMYKFAKFDAPWDMTIRFYTRRSLHNTKLIQHRWRTQNYRAEGDQIICDNAPNDHGTDNAGPVSPDAVVIHGCKDGSLARLIISRLGEVVIPEAPAPQQTSTPKQAEPGEVKPDLTGVHYDEADFRTFATRASQNKEFIAVTTDETKLVMDVLKSIGRATRVQEITKQTGLSMVKIRDMAKKDDCPFEISGPGWVRERVLENIEA